MNINMRILTDIICISACVYYAFQHVYTVSPIIQSV